MEANIRPSKKPFVPKASTLSITTTASPLSPRFFSFPSPGLSKSKATSPRFSTSPPLTPPAWSWSCHQCQTTYPLGATRRCLYDGHYFCAGTTVNKRTGRVKRHKPCGSIFDYVGWKEYGDWRRNEQRFAERKASRVRSLQSVTEDEHDSSSLTDEDAEGSDKENLTHQQPHNCETDCNFPSECRWRPRLPKEKLKRLSPTLSEPEESKEENGMAREQEILFDLEPELERKADFENEPDTPMPPPDVGCRQHSMDTAEDANSTADAVEIPKPLRVRRKAVGSGASSIKSKSKSKSKTRGFFSSPYSSPPPSTSPSTRSSSSTSNGPPRLPELHFPSIPVPDFSIFKARLDALLAPIPPYNASQETAQFPEQRPQLYSPTPRSSRSINHRALHPKSFFDFSGDESDSDDSSNSSSSSDLFSRPLGQQRLSSNPSMTMQTGSHLTSDAIAYATDPISRPVRAALLLTGSTRHTPFAVEEDGLVLSSPESDSEMDASWSLLRIMRRRERERGDWSVGGGLGAGRAEEIEGLIA